MARGRAKAASGSRVAGRPDGAWTYWYPIGERMLVGAYRNGLADGLWQVFDTNGELVQLGCFKAGEKRWGTMSPSSQRPDC